MKFLTLYLLTILIFFSYIQKGNAKIDDRYIDSTLVDISNHLAINCSDSLYYQKLELFNKNLAKYKIENGITKKYLLGRGYYANGIIEVNYEKAINVFDESLNYCSEYGYKRTGALISNDLANIIYNNGEYEKALKIFLSNVEIFKAVKDWGAYAWLLIDIGNVYFGEEFYNKAKDYYFQSKNIFQKYYDNEKLDGGLAVCYQNLGIANEKLNYRDSAYVYYMKSLESRKKAKQYGNYSVAYSYIANYFIKNNQLDSGEYYIKKAIESDLQNAPNSNLNSSYRTYISFLLDNGRYDEAKSVALKNYKLLLKDSNNVKLMFALNSLGRCYYSLNKLDSALYYFKSSADKAKIINNYSFYSNVLNNIIKVLKREGSFEQTPYYYEELLKVKEWLLNNTATKLQLEKEMEARKLEVHSFEIEKKRNRIINISLIIIIVLVLIILALVFRAEIKRKKQNNRLKEVLKELKETNEHLNKTYSIIAHDLKGPLGSVIGLIELMIDGDTDREDWPDYLEVVNKTLNQTNSLMHNLLDWSRIKGEKMSFNSIKLNVGELLESVVSLHIHSIESKSIRLIKEIDFKCYVYSDKNMFLTIIRSLLSNAIKFTPEGGSIIIHASCAGDKVLIKVKDNGVGMTDKQIQDALDINTFSTSVGTNDEKGSGFGLKLVIDMLKRNNSKLEIASKVGEGSEFSFYLEKA